LFESYPGGQSTLSTEAPARVGALAYFWKTDLPTATRAELWKTDGTAAGTALVGTFAGIQYDKLAPFGTRLAFLAYDAAGIGLWVTDGTASGTSRLQVVAPASLNVVLPRPQVLGNRLYYAANDATSGTELWSTDGTAAGTQLVKDIAPGQ